MYPWADCSNTAVALSHNLPPNVIALCLFGIIITVCLCICICIYMYMHVGSMYMGSMYNSILPPVSRHSICAVDNSTHVHM